MNVHEYQAKELFREYGVAVPDGGLATTPDQAQSVAQRLGKGISVVKAQVHAGGRGKGGGIKLAQTPEEARGHAEAILGMTLVTKQTGAEGKASKVRTAAMWPLSTCTHAPVSRSQIRISSSDPEARCLPSRSGARHSTSPVWPCSVRVQAPEAASHTMTRLARI